MSLSALPKDTLIQIFSHLRPSESKLAATCRTARNAYVDFCDKVLKETALSYGKDIWSTLLQKNLVKKIFFQKPPESKLVTICRTAINPYGGFCDKALKEIVLSYGEDKLHDELIRHRLFTHEEIEILHDPNAMESQKDVLRKRFPKALEIFFEKPEKKIKKYKYLFFSKIGQKTLNSINDTHPEIYSLKRISAINAAISSLAHQQNENANSIEAYFDLPYRIVLPALYVFTESSNNFSLPMSLIKFIGLRIICGGICHGIGLEEKAARVGKATGRFFANCCKALKII